MSQKRSTYSHYIIKYCLKVKFCRLCNATCHVSFLVKVIHSLSSMSETLPVILACSCELLIRVTVFPVVTQPTASTAPPSTAEETKTPDAPKPKKNRCFMCRKKVGLTGGHSWHVHTHITAQMQSLCTRSDVLMSGLSGFDCRCGNLFCGLHRYSDKHNCPYDYKAEAAAKIRKENPVVVADKIQRI